jgi:hypothetical protein
VYEWTATETAYRASVSGATGSPRKVSQRSLTPRSSGAPTAWRPGRAAPTSLSCTARPGRHAVGSRLARTLGSTCPQNRESRSHRMQAARSARHGRFLGFVGVTTGFLRYGCNCASGALPSAKAHTLRSAIRQAGKTLGCRGGRAGGVPPPLASAAGTGRVWWRTDRQYKLSAGNVPSAA